MKQEQNGEVCDGPADRGNVIKLDDYRARAPEKIIDPITFDSLENPRALVGDEMAQIEKIYEDLSELMELISTARNDGVDLKDPEIVSLLRNFSIDGKYSSVLSELEGSARKIKSLIRARLTEGEEATETLN